MSAVSTTWESIMVELGRDFRGTAPIDFVSGLYSWVNKKGSEVVPGFKEFPHAMVFAIEANAAMYNSSFGSRKHAPRYDLILNRVRAPHEQPDLDMIASNPWLFFRWLYRRQIPHQQKERIHDFARIQRMYVESQAIIKARHLWDEQFDWSIQDWIYLTSLFYVGPALDRPLEKITLNTVRGFLDNDALWEAFIAEFSFDTEFARSHWKQKRLRAVPQFRFNAESIFIKRPIFQVQKGLFCVPLSGALISKLERSIRQSIKVVDKQISSDCFDEYVATWISLLKSPIAVVSEDVIKRKFKNKKVCDYIVEFSDSIVAIELKDIAFDRDVLSEEVIVKDTTTGEIAKGYEQLSSCALLYIQGHLESFGLTPGKPFYGVVVTSGDVPMSNSPWYYETIIGSKSKVKLSFEAWPEGMNDIPACMPIGDFELLTEMIEYGLVTMERIQSDRRRIGYKAAGEWGVYLRNTLRANNGGNVQRAPEVERAFNDSRPAV